MERGALPCPQCSASECQVTAEALWKHGLTFALWGARQLLTRLETLSQEPGAQDRQEGAPALHPGSRGACTQDIHLSGCFPFTSVNPSSFPGPHASGTPCASSADLGDQGCLSLVQ